MTRAPKRRKVTWRRMRESDIEFVLLELDRWAAGARGRRLTWRSLEIATGYSRQALASKPSVAQSFREAKDALRLPPPSDAKKWAPRKGTFEQLNEAIVELQKEVTRYRRLEAGWLERWTRITYHAQTHGISIAQLDRPLPNIDRK